MKSIKKISLLAAVLILITGSLTFAQTVDAPHFISIKVSSDPYNALSGEPLTITVAMDAAGQMITANVKVTEVSSGYLILQDTFRAGDGNNQLIWNGKQIGNTMPAPGGTYKITVNGEYRLKVPGNGTLPEISKTFTVNSPVKLEDVLPPAEDTLSTTTGGTATATLKPAQELISCGSNKNSFQLDKNGKPNDQISMNCNLTSSSLVKAGIYKSEYNPANADNSGSLVRTLINNKKMSAGDFTFSWDGLDDYDQPVAAGDYVIAAEARPDNTYLPDVSMQKFKVVAFTNPASPAPEVVTPPAGNSSLVVPASATPVVPTSTTPAAQTPAPVQEQQSTTEVGAGPSAGQPSKCPGLNYPLDLTTGRFESDVIKAYDRCWVGGFPDRTFRPDSTMTRAEATKVMVLAAQLLPKQGCYTLDCGSPFKDLEAWQGAWVRAAWDARIISGIAPTRFAPNRPITRAEAAALVVKGLKIEPHQGCYTPNCGAGFPNNFFQDISKMWEGPYLRALWDRGAAIVRAPHKFEPESPITRGEFLEMLIDANG